MTDVILSASNLSVGFHGRKRRALLQGLTLTLSPDRLSCLIGRNGVGKSTLIRTLAGLQKPIAGTVSAAGEDLYRIPPENAPASSAPSFPAASMSETSKRFRSSSWDASPTRTGSGG